MNVSNPDYAAKVAALAPDAWEKPARSGPVSDNCAEFADLGDGTVAFRSTRNRTGPVIILDRGEMGALIDSMKDGQFDRFAG